MKVCVVGATGAFGQKHLEALRCIEDVTVTAMVAPEQDKLDQLITEYNQAAQGFATLEEALKSDNIDAVILATPTQMHAAQAIQCMEAGKHVLVEIPMADNIEDSYKVVETQKKTGVVAMAGHTRRFNPSHQWIHNKIAAGELNIQQMDVQTYFFRRTNTNAKGEPRTWTDHLLWHHACHTVDLFQYQTGEKASKIQALQGPIHPELNIAMDMSIGMKTPSGALCTLSLSFNNDGPFGTFFRYICDEGTYIARYDDLFDGKENPISLEGVAVSNNGIELIDREFFDAIRTGREPNSSVASCLPAMETLHELELVLEAE
ncbi:4-carboxy-2-hydroxymuconate-6-semialdehyde dehydrogenase [Vibrio campbellii]|uniref:Gfo/Idh/MocA family oxidoreductase n=1 Tax=Vibrio campbellii TaxID=680 RepID=UPI00097FBB93|nr:Gfo/Idh/MocA family oxidoreductase [Vibrio campbellii]AQM66789.1 4-carboxy-2-hydroxymuconate-6-semialdehyde dehydrogenase [Vibrio campbellii]